MAIDDKQVVTLTVGDLRQLIRETVRETVRETERAHGIGTQSSARAQRRKAVPKEHVEPRPEDYAHVIWLRFRRGDYTRAEADAQMRKWAPELTIETARQKRLEVDRAKRAAKRGAKPKE